MTTQQIKELAQKYHTPGDRVSERWNPIYQEECRKINRKVIEESLMKKYNVSGKINKKTQGSTLFVGMGKA
tara:strand:- start:4130 stop:4342 length:213 start_codon:yes stop_codon:yes gene_type:complete